MPAHLREVEKPKQAASPFLDLLVLAGVSEKNIALVLDLPATPKKEVRKLQHTFEKITEYMISNPDTLTSSLVEAYTILATTLWRAVGKQTKGGIDQAVQTLITKLPKEKFLPAQLHVLWKQHTPSEDDLLVGLLPLIPTAMWDKVGDVLYAAAHEHQTLDEIFEELKKSHIELPPTVMQAMIQAFAEANLVQLSNNKNPKKRKIRTTRKGESLPAFTADHLRRVVLANQFLVVEPPKSDHFSSFKDVADAQANHQERIRIESHTFNIPKNGSKILYLSEILFGNKDTDIHFLQSLLEHLRKLPKQELPDIIVVSGIVQGAFQYRQKDRRRGLTDSMSTMSKQFAAAKLFMDQLLKLGVPVVYNLSNDDREVVENYTLETMRMLKNAGKPLADTEKRFINYKQREDLKASKEWERHYRFQQDVVFPYCLRTGRSLLSADEVREKTHKKLNIEEYFLLYQVYQKMMDGEMIDNAQYGNILVLENIPVPGKEFSYHITDDTNLQLHTNHDTQTVWMRHLVNFSGVPVYQDPTNSQRALLGQLAAQGAELPTTFVQQHAQQGLAAGFQDTLLLSTPGLLRANFQQRGSVFYGSGDPVRRAVTTRRLLPTSGAVEHERTEDGRDLLHVYTENLLDKAYAGDRETVALFTDWQTGSVTHRPDLAVKFVDMVLYEYLRRNPVRILLGGDIIQGRNYPGMDMENDQLGLVALGKQKAFVQHFLEQTFDSLPTELVKNLLEVDAYPGNHEWNSGWKLYGDTHTHYLLDIIRRLRQSRNISEAQLPIRLFDTVETKNGEYFRSWTGTVNNIAKEYRLLVQHMMLEKGAKGDGGGLPVYQAKTLFEGLGYLVNDIDAAAFGHWHFRQFGLFNGKIAVVSPAMAGISGYEWMRAHSSQIGAMLMHFGGKRAPTIEFLSKKTLDQYVVQNPYFKPSHLKKLGYQDDPHYDAAVNGFTNRRKPQSALQKALWGIRDEVLFDGQTMLG